MGHRLRPTRGLGVLLAQHNQLYIVMLDTTLCQM